MATIPSIKADKRLSRAIDYVSDYWLPVNPQVARKIRASIDSGTFESDRFLLKNEICADLGLFFGCIRELKRVLSEKNSDFNLPLDMTRIFEDVDTVSLQLALDSLLSAPSVHLMNEGENSEVGRLLEAVISMTAAQTMAPAYNQSPGAATSAAALRQLGLALIAWNYPVLYKDCLARLHDNPALSLDTLLSNALGFSPMVLASGLASKWGVSAALQHACSEDDTSDSDDDMTVRAVGSTLRQICEVSEKLARAQMPDHYPSAKSDWETATKEIERMLGPQGIERIRERCTVACASYLATSPDIFRPGLLLEEQHLNQIAHSHANPYLDGSSESVQKGLTRLYELVDLPRSSSKALHLLIKEILPAAKFSGGCIFTVDPTCCQLIPQLDIGPCEARTIAPIHYMVDNEGEDPILLAYLTAEGCKPILVEDNRSGMCSITSTFGRGQRLGVLYLEIPLEEMRNNKALTMTHFQGAVHALVDCLKGLG